MPDEHMHEPEMPQDSAGDMSEEPAAKASSPMSQLGDFSTGEGMVALGGMIILAVWLIFEVFADRYGFSHLAIVLAATAVILPRVDRAKVEAFHPLSSIMKVVGFALTLIGISEIVSDVEGGLFTGASGLTILAALIGYAGFVAAFMGARSIKI